MYHVNCYEYTCTINEAEAIQSENVTFLYTGHQTRFWNLLHTFHLQSNFNLLFA